MSVDSQSDFPLCPHDVNIEHFLCPVTANQKRFRQEERAESEAAGEGVCSQGCSKLIVCFTLQNVPGSQEKKKRKKGRENIIRSNLVGFFQVGGGESGQNVLGRVIRNKELTWNGLILYEVLKISVIQSDIGATAENRFTEHQCAGTSSQPRFRIEYHIGKLSMGKTALKSAGTVGSTSVLHNRFSAGLEYQLEFP